MNNSLLKDVLYVNEIKQTINDTIISYAEADDLAIVNESKDKIKFKINDQLFF